VADEVVPEQPLHDDGNGTATLVIQSAVEGVVKPLIGGFLLRPGQSASSGSYGSSIRIMSAPRPVSAARIATPNAER
jgi:hypothetical protein